MKNSIENHSFKVFLFILIWAISISCSKKEEDILPITDGPQLKEDVAKLDLKGNEGTAELITDATAVTEISNGYKLEGSIGAKVEIEGTFDIAKGNFVFTVDGNGNITKITGEGTVDFPNVGVFKKIRESFAWEKIKSHIEYEKGSFYKDTYNTDIPLNDDRYYFHFQVFDQNDEEGFTLKHLGNLIVYNFTDFYLDINDPAVFFKMQLWKPGSGSKSEATSVAKKLFAKLKATGKAAVEYASAPGIVIGISNQATINSSSYEFSKPEIFQELYGYSGFDEIGSNGYIKLKNIPIPETVILRFTGDMYVHGPLEKGGPAPGNIIDDGQNAFVDWFNETELGPVSRTINGSMDFGGKGIGFVFGILNGIDEALGYDVLSNEANFDLLGAAYQEQSAGEKGEATSFVRFGGEFRTPILSAFFGESISRFIPASGATGFLYFNIEDNLDNWSIFIENNAEINVPVIGNIEFSNSYFLVSKDGIFTEGHLGLPEYDGVFKFDQKISGSIRPDRYDLESEYNKEINLPNGIRLTSKNTYLKISSKDGLNMEGSTELPLGVVSAEFKAAFTNEEVSFEGEFSEGLDLGYGYDLPSRSMTFMTSTDPDKGISYAGEMDVPHIGYNKVTGAYNISDFSFSGEVDRTIDFAGVNLPISNGQLSLNNTGMELNGKFSLPYGLKTAQMAGSITKEEIKMSGTMASSIKIAGVNFAFSNSFINASSISGVKMGGRINLKQFSTNVTGAINPNGTFRMTGSYTHKSKFLVTKINVVVTQSAVSLSGTGTIYGAFGNKLASGKVTFQPNWAAGTVKACINGYCVNL